MENAYRRTRALRIVAALFVILSSLVFLARPPSARAEDFVVTSTSDNNVFGTLRNAINNANLNPNNGPHTITFDIKDGPGQNCTTDNVCTIELSGQPLTINRGEITIDGTGADITIGVANPDTNPLQNLLAIDKTSAQAVKVNLIDLTFNHRGIVNLGGQLNVSAGTLTGMKGSSGNAIANTSKFNPDDSVDVAVLTLTDSLIVDNFTSGEGGGSAIANISGRVTAIGSTFQRNGADNSSVAGGAILSVGPSAIVSVNNSTFYDNEAYYGGAIANISGNLEVINSTFSENSVNDTGGAISSSSSLELKLIHNTFYNNDAAFNARTIASSSDRGTVFNNFFFNSQTDSNCVIGTGSLNFSGNLSVDTSCGGVATAGLALLPLGDTGGPTPTHSLPTGSPAIDYASINADACPAADQRGFARSDGDCDAGAYEVAASCVSPYSAGNDAELSEAIRCVNAAVAGGEHVINLTADFTVYVASGLTLGTPLLNNPLATVTINGNEHTLTALDKGRFFTIVDTGLVKLNNVTLTGGHAGNGGAIGVENSTMEVTDSVFTDNRATIDGGAIYSGESDLTVTRGRFTENWAGDNGGAIFSHENSWHARELTKLISSTFTDNKAIFTGGAVRVDGSIVEVTNSTFARNKTNLGVGQVGGAIDVNINGELAVMNSTFSENEANVGGAITNLGLVNVSHSTFFGNKSIQSGEAVFSQIGTFNLKNSLFVDNGDVACYNVTADNSNIVDSDSECSNAAVFTTAEIRLLPLADNGGPTQTHALRVGSAAIDYEHINTEDDYRADTDQRGVARPQGDGRDAGAYEAQTAQLSVTKSANPSDNTLFPFTIDPGRVLINDSWGEAGFTGSNFFYPGETAVDADGNVYVADGGNNRVQKYDRHGNFILTFGKGVLGGDGFEICLNEQACQAGQDGSLSGEFSFPAGLAVDTEGNVYVVDAFNTRIQKFSSDAEFILTFGWDVDPDQAGEGFEVCSSDHCRNGIPGDGAGQFSIPVNVALDELNNVYVVDQNLNSVQKFSSPGSVVAFEMAFGWDVIDDGEEAFEVCTQAQSESCKSGVAESLAGGFNVPLALAVDADGHIYVVDQGNERIQKFDSSGAFVLAFGKDVVDGGGDGFEVCRPDQICQQGSAGEAAGEFSYPAGVAVDFAGNVLVSDPGNQRIQKFNGNGEFLLAFGGDVVENGPAETGFEVCLPTDNCRKGQEGDAAGQFKAPWGVDVGADGRIFVADSNNHRIQVFSLAAGTRTLLLGDTGIQTYDVAPGTYLISELVPDGWELDNINCDASFSTTDGTVAIVTLAADEHVTCNYHNVKPVTDPCPAVDGNVITNFCFEDGSAPWTFHSDGHGVYNVSPFEPFAGNGAAEIKITVPGSNVQFYQSGIGLQGDTEYELTFAAKSKDGRDLSVFVHKHGANYASYGLSNHVFNLTDSWAEYTVTFKTPVFSGGSVNDARLRFWLAPFDAAGAVYSIDRVVLRPAGGDPLPEPPPPPDPEVPPQGECTATPGNLIANPGYEDGTFGWSFFTNGSANFTAPEEPAADPYECDANARVKINTSGNNVQLFQTGIELQPNTHYRLRLAAKATGANAVQLFVQRHSAPHSNYGLNGLKLDLTSDWQVFVVDFTTSGFASTTTDTRLRFWLAPYDTAGAVFEFDDVVLTPVVADPFRAADGAATRGGTAKATTADAYLVSGYFIDNNHTDRLGGGYVGVLDGCRNARASVSRLWPANNKLWPVSIGNIGTPQSVAITGVWQDEPVGFEPDAVIGSGGALHLRAERDLDAGADGRVYTIQFRATYADGQSCNGIVTVGVPLSNRRGVEARSGGELFTSTDK